MIIVLKRNSRDTDIATVSDRVCDGNILDAHPDPLNAFRDAAQQLVSGTFDRFLADLAPWIELARKERNVPSPV